MWTSSEGATLTGFCNSANAKGFSVIWHCVTAELVYSWSYSQRRNLQVSYLVATWSVEQTDPIHKDRRGPTWAIEHRLLSLGPLSRAPCPATCVSTQQLLQCCV